MGWFTYVWVMFSIILRNNIPRARTQEYECENARKGRTDADRDGEEEEEEEEEGKGKLSKSHAYKSVELLRRAPFCSWRGLALAEQIRESKQPNQRPTHPHPHEPSYSWDRDPARRNTCSTLSPSKFFFPLHKLMFLFQGIKHLGFRCQYAI